MEIHRDENGVVKINGKKVAKIPFNQSILSYSTFVPNGDYTVDPDWIYVKGKPFRKQLHKVSGFAWETTGVWLPNIADLKSLEKRYWKVLLAERKFMKEKYGKAFNAVVKVGQAHAKISHKYIGNQSPWYLYDADKLGISFRWTDTPETPLNLEIGQKWYDVQKYAKSVFRREKIFRAALEARFILELDKKTGSKSGFLKNTPTNLNTQVWFKINNRHYWFYATPNRVGVYRWQVLSWPTDETKMFSI